MTTLNSGYPSFLKRRPISFTNDIWFPNEVGWAHRPDAVYELAECRNVRDDAVIEFARWMAWRFPTTSRVHGSSSLTEFVDAYTNYRDRVGEVPDSEQAVEALKLSGVDHRISRGGEVSLAVAPYITQAVISPETRGYIGSPRFLERITVTEEKLREAYDSLDVDVRRSWFPQRRWYANWDDAVLADTELKKQSKYRELVEPWVWVSTRGVEAYQQITDCVRDWFPTTDAAPLYKPTAYQLRPKGTTFKHLLETDTGKYIAVGDFVLAARMLGLKLLFRGTVVYASVVPKFSMTMVDRNISSPWHGTPRIELHGRQVPGDYVVEGVYTVPVQEGDI